MAEKNNNTICDPIHITAILARLENNHCQLQIEEFNRDNTIQLLGISEILHIDSTKNNILFDALNQSSITAEQHIKVFAKHDGVEINFNAKVTGLTERNHITYFNTDIPGEITYKQRRQQYRAELQNLWKIPVTLLDKKINSPLTAYIYNISTGGINVRSSTDNLIQIKQGAIIETLIQLPSAKNIQCKLQVRQIKSDQKTGLQQLAGQFIGLAPKQGKSIQSFVNSVERNRIKTTAKQPAEYN